MKNAFASGPFLKTVNINADGAVTTEIKRDPASRWLVSKSK